MNLYAVSAVGLYVALNAFILFYLANATGAIRRKLRVMVGDGGQPALQKIMRGHANAIEIMPMTFLLLLIAALMGLPAWAIHGLGIVFTVGRAIHAWHFAHDDSPFRYRIVGFGLSVLVFALLAVGVFGHAVWTLVR